MRNRQGPWSGPECPWCDFSTETTQRGTVVEPDDTYDVFSCRFGHDLRVPHNRNDALSEEDVETYTDNDGTAYQRFSRSEDPRWHLQNQEEQQTGP